MEGTANEEQLAHREVRLFRRVWWRPRLQLHHSVRARMLSIVPAQLSIQIGGEELGKGKKEGKSRR